MYFFEKERYTLLNPVSFKTVGGWDIRLGLTGNLGGIYKLSFSLLREAVGSYGGGVGDLKFEGRLITEFTVWDTIVPSY